MTNFELGVHIPLIIRAPWIASSIGQETAVLAEMVDMLPTLAQLAGLPDPRKVSGSEGINGTSLVPALLDPANTTDMKPAAFSQFSKNNAPGDPEGGPGGTSVACTFFRNATKLMGYTIRTHEWRYTAWWRFDNQDARGPCNDYEAPCAGSSFFGGIKLNESLGTELYDHRGDSGKWLDWPGENVNLVNHIEYASVVKKLHGQLLDYIQLPKV
eukprot:SAG31_NODE_3060_length_4732_cov_2.919706_6_plen_213_part_00